MVMAIILGAILVTSVILKKTSLNSSIDNDFRLTMVSFLSGGLLLIHCLCVYGGYFDYIDISESGKGLRATIESFRASGVDVIERAAIYNKISDWNMEVAVRKELNKNWFIDPYVDDRIEDLDFIR